MITLAKKNTISYKLANGALVRPILPDDVNSIYVDGLNNPLISKYLVPHTKKHTFNSVREYVDISLNSQDSILFGLFVDNSLRGTSRLHDIDFINQTAWVGVAIFDAAIHGCGYGFSLISSVIDFSVNMIYLTYIKAGIHEDNIPSEKLFKKVGFVYDAPYESQPGCHIWAYKIL